MSRIRVLLLTGDDAAGDRDADCTGADRSVEVVTLSGEGRDAPARACLVQVDAILVGKWSVMDVLPDSTTTVVQAGSRVEATHEVTRPAPAPDLPVFVADGGGPAEHGGGRSVVPAYYEPGRPKLTRMELEVLRLVAQGKKNAAIAAELYISVNTVKTHIQSIFRKLRIENRSQAVRYALLGAAAEGAAEDEPEKWRSDADAGRALRPRPPGGGNKGELN